MQTLNQIKRKLNGLQEAHPQINSFFFGDRWEVGASGDIRYALMGCILQPGALARKVDSLRLVLFFADLVNEGETNEDEVLSDTRLIALDVVAQFWAWCEENQIVLTPGEFSHFTEKDDDSVSGWQVALTLNQFYSRDSCQVPVRDSYMLTESGDFLLLENEDKIIL